MDSYNKKSLNGVTGCLILVKFWNWYGCECHSTYHLKGWPDIILCIVSDRVGV